MERERERERERELAWLADGWKHPALHPIRKLSFTLTHRWMNE
jgi:hypothetical protein